MNTSSTYSPAIPLRTLFSSRLLPMDNSTSTDLPSNFTTTVLPSNFTSTTVTPSNYSSTPAPPIVRPFLALWDESRLLIVLAFLCGLVAIFTNTFLVLLILFNRKLRKVQVNWYIMLLGVADLVIGISIPFRPGYILYAMSRHLIQYPKLSCSLVNILKSFGFTFARICVLAIALDRLWAVLRPLTYKGRFRPGLFAAVASLAIGIASFDTALKYVGLNDPDTPLLLCSLALAKGPYGETFATPFTYACLALLLAIYVPFIIIYLWKDKFSQNQIQITATVVWLILFYLFFWGFSYAVGWAQSFLIMVLGEQFLANNNNNLGAYSSFMIGWVGNLSSTAAFFNYLWKHEEIRKHSKAVWDRVERRLAKMGASVKPPVKSAGPRVDTLVTSEPR